MAKLQSGTRIYGTANVDTYIYIGTSNTTTGTGGILANTTFILIGNNTSNSTLSAVGLTVGTSFVANTTRITIAGAPLYANGGAGTSGQVLTSNGTTGAPYWAAAAGGGAGSLTLAANNTDTATYYIRQPSQRCVH